MVDHWVDSTPGLLRLPSGRLIRGRGLGRGRPPGQKPTLGLYLLGTRPDPFDWESRWLAWPDFRLPADPGEAARAFEEVLARTDSERVEVACHGGHGRTGTALACIAILDGVDPAEAVGYVRERYARRAVETPWQKRFVRRFRRASDAG